MVLTGRRAECSMLSELVADVVDGQSRTLVLHGEPGIGKTALLEYLAPKSARYRVVRATGVQSEMELAFSGLHQLCAPMLDLMDRLPTPQRTALRTAFGMSMGPVPNRFLIGLAVLGLLAEYAADKPLVCLVDDQQWLDDSTALVLAFVARRLVAESVGLLFATRVPGTELAGLPQFELRNLNDADARTLLDAALTVPLDTALRDRIVAESRGNPLALVEVPKALASPGLAGGFGLPGSVRHAGRIEDSFRVRVDALPDDARRLLVVASAEPAGDPSLVWTAAASLGIEPDAAIAAIESGLADFGVFVRFRHPLARSVVYRSASSDERRSVHGALAGAIDAVHDPDRRAWHRAQAVSGPDDAVADELEESASRAQARGGLAAAAAFLERSAMLTVAPDRRAVRALGAAAAKADAGESQAAHNLLTIAVGGPLDEFGQAQADLIRAQLAFIASHGSDVPPLMLHAARRLEPVDAALARASYLRAFEAASFAGRLSPELITVEVAGAAASSVRELSEPTASDLLLRGLASHYVDGYAAALPTLRQAVKALRSGTTESSDIHCLYLAFVTAVHIWDDDGWYAISTKYVETARDQGALSELPLALISLALIMPFSGDLDTAQALNHETGVVIEATGSGLARLGALTTAAFRGSEADFSALFALSIESVTRRGAGIGITLAEWANAVLNNGLGRYSSALDAARKATEYWPDLGSSTWALVERVEAAARLGRSHEAVSAYQRLAEMTGSSATDWGLGIGARTGALVTKPSSAEPLYLEAIERLGRTRMRADLARAHLLYGEWLSQAHRRAEAREQLRKALTMFDGIGMQAFAERARRALRAAGETARDRNPATGMVGDLTAQEAQIARLARAGLSNPEIGARLFISSRTVQYHLRKVFAKLGISSRNQLDRVLSEDEDGPAPQR